MQLSPREVDKLLITQVGTLAQRRLARGLRLNHAEALALIASVLHELIRDGAHSVAELMALGATLLGRRHVLPSVPHTLTELQVEGTFRMGTYLVTVHNPIRGDDGDLARALYGSFLPVPEAGEGVFPWPAKEGLEAYEDERLMPGAVVAVKGEAGRVVLGEGRRRVRLRVVSRGDRPIQVGSHYHFVEVNPRLEFDRMRSRGFRLDIAAGTSVRFEPGDSKTVTLVQIGGRQMITGGNGLATGHIHDEKVAEGMLRRMQEGGFLHKEEPASDQKLDPFSMGREAYIAMFGPTVGDRIRLGSTDLWIKIEKDYAKYGDEATFGGGKSIRDGMGQAPGWADDECLDTVIVNAIVVDWTGIYKADIGIKKGLIAGIGKAGNPYVMEGVHKDMVIGSNTDVIAAEHMIVTAGGFDSHIHFICPQQAYEAIASGITTFLGGGTGPSTGTNATTCTPSKDLIKGMYQATDHLPLNIGITGKGNDSEPPPLREQVEAGVCGLKLHEDWGTTPAAIDTCLSVCDEQDIQCLIHTDTLNESGFVETTVAAFKNRTIHTYHTEGAGGGHAPDIISVGMSHLIGSVEVGKLADLVLWNPVSFGVKPAQIVKGGMIAWSMMGDPNASIPTVEPVIMRPMFGAMERGRSVAWVSRAGVEGGVVGGYGLGKRVEVVKGCRGVGKRDMKWNDAMPKMKVDPERYTVHADGQLMTAEPATELPLAQSYFIY
ncbi:hypothetical protein LTR48_002316 [Friedmanniomyces endolithicus]|nr:hypothetical protein LTR48_002316 [Friedmanniomyces endolithicus]